MKERGREDIRRKEEDNLPPIQTHFRENGIFSGKRKHAMNLPSTASIRSWVKFEQFTAFLSITNKWFQLRHRTDTSK